jgi:peptidoglycan/LPS O-acetylase OafA/YrhL
MSVDRISQTGRFDGWFRELAGRIRGKEIAYPLGYMASLDGARGLLTLGVLLAHTRMALFSGAMVYMDVFFTMSGFLITSLLIKDFQKRGRISLKNFYLRRIMRLYPALTAMVIAFIALSFFLSDRFDILLTEALVSWFYLMDYWWALGQTPVYYTGHTWSLAVEEQFYLLWPLVFIVLLRVSGLTVRTAGITFALALLFWAWRIWLTYDGASIRHLYNAFDTRADALLIGCGLAVLLKTIDIADYPRIWRACALSMLPVALALLAAGFTMDHNYRWYYYVSPLFGAFPAVIAIVGLLHPNRTLMHMIQEHPVPVFIGRICYGLYIWHFPIFTWIVGWAHEYRYATVFVIGWPLTFAAATLSFYLIERPFMRARPGV